MKILSFTEKRINIFNYKPLFISFHNYYEPINLATWQSYKKLLIIKIKGINEINEAKKLTNYQIITNKLQNNKKKNDYYWQDLIGCKVIHINGSTIGQVINLIATGSNDVLVLSTKQKLSGNNKEQLIPFIENQVIKKVDLDHRLIEVNWDNNF